uniref:Succinate dehydrogenase subunit 3 n=1 Tax=Cyanophora paradoxa TaxID=2762 RepID=A0A097PBS1_CYAPA|nr:succinate dehydrogenase subunit 3 [Cyanophora paradoxa]
MQIRLKVISPHLNIYNLELQSGLSILNRISGLLLALYFLYFLIIEELFYQVLSINSLKYSLYCFLDLFDSEFTASIGILISIIVLLHFLCGIRHIIWDFNIGLTKKALKISHLIIVTLVLTSFFLDIFFQVIFTMYFYIITHQ